MSAELDHQPAVAGGATDEREAYRIDPSVAYRVARESTRAQVTLTLVIILPGFVVFGLLEPTLGLKELAWGTLAGLAALVLGAGVVDLHKERTTYRGEVRISALGIEFDGRSSTWSMGGRIPWSLVGRVQTRAGLLERRRGVVTLTVYARNYSPPRNAPWAKPEWRTQPARYIRAQYLSRGQAAQIEMRCKEMAGPV
jgi:hypothetical protein